jgi:peptidoglycan/LPS O-acetylase OafA/YrhL
VEWRIYFIFPLLIYCWNRFGALRTVATVAIVSYLLLIPLSWTPINSSDTGVCLHYYGLFSFGMLAAGLVFSANESLVRLRRRLPWGFLFIVMWAVAIGCNKGSVLGHRSPWQIEDLFVGLGTLSLLVALSPGENSDPWHWLRNALNWTPLVFVGTFSYSLYLLHAPLLEILWRYWIKPLKLSSLHSFILLSTVGLAAVIAVSYLFFLLFERPFMRSGKRRTSGTVRQSEPAQIAGETVLEAESGPDAALAP